MNDFAIESLVKRLAAQADGFAAVDLVKASGLSRSLASRKIARFVDAGTVFLGKAAGHHGRYFDSAERAAAFSAGRPLRPGFGVAGDPVALATAATKRLRGTTLSSTMLAKALGTTPEAIDAALQPLVAAAKLVRVSVQRFGMTEYDYRWGAAWVPQPDDFALCRGALASTPASVSPLPSPPAPPAPPSSPTQAPAAPQATREPAPATPAPVTPAAPSAPPSAPPSAASQAELLGWQDAPAGGGTDDAGIIDANDLVCGLSSRGVLVLDLGEITVRMQPAVAIELKRFLVRSTVIEAVLAGGCHA